MIKDNPVRVYFTAMYELQKEKMESQRSVALNCIERAKMLIDSQKEYLKQELESLRNKDYSEAERDIEKQGILYDAQLRIIRHEQEIIHQQKILKLIDGSMKV